MCSVPQETPLFGAHSPPVLNLSPGLNPVTMDAHQRMSPTYDVINDGESRWLLLLRRRRSAAGWRTAVGSPTAAGPLQSFPEQMCSHAACFLASRLD